jgi:isocitrate lyase
VDPAITYVHRRDADVQDIPSLSMQSEQFAVAKLAERISRHCMSEAYHKLQRESSSSHVKYLHPQLIQVFDAYLKRIHNRESTLAQVISRFTTSFNWPIPDEHFRTSY